VGPCNCIDTLEWGARPDTLDWEAELTGPSVPILVSDCSWSDWFPLADIDEQQLIALRVHGQQAGVHAPVEVKQGGTHANWHGTVVSKLEPAVYRCKLDVGAASMNSKSHILTIR
jgi:hypothetical protein